MANSERHVFSMFSSIYARTCARPSACRASARPPAPRASRPRGAAARGGRGRRRRRARLRRRAAPLGPASRVAACRSGGGVPPGVPRPRFGHAGPPSLSALPRGTSHGRDLAIYPHTRLDALLIAVRVPPRVRVARPVRARTGASGHQRHRQSPLVLGRVRSSPASSSRPANHRCAPLTGRGRKQAAGRA